jgi:hypothetical protein
LIGTETGYPSACNDATYGGESNYSWVRRATIQAEDWRKTATVMRRAKKAVGISGLRGKTYDYGDLIEFRPYGMATVLFVTVRYR